MIPHFCVFAIADFKKVPPASPGVLVVCRTIGPAKPGYWLCGVAFKGLNKLDKTNLWSFGAAGLIGALCNTVLFMTTLCLCFYNTDYIQGFVAALGSANAFLFVIAFVGVNGLVEGAVCLITGAAIAKAVMYSRGKLAARKTNA